MFGASGSGLKHKFINLYRQLRDHLHPQALKSKFWSINFLITCLFWTGALASAMQGYFSINIFITSLGSAVSWLAFLNAIPYIVIFACATIIAIYSIRVESQVFRPYFEKLIKQFLGDPNVKKNHNDKTIELKYRFEQLKPKTTEASTIEKTGFAKLLYKIKYYLQLLLAVEKSTDSKYSFAWFFNRLRYYFAHSLAVGVMGLRAIVSIGSTMLGLKSIFLLIASAFLITSLPTYFIPLYALMSGVGYFIKTSQNLVDQFHETLKILGFKRYIKKDYEAVKTQYKKGLKKALGLSKNTAITKDVLPHVPPPAAIISEPVKDLPLWKKVFYWLKANIKNILWYVLTLGFCIGAVGASMTGFFSITSFITQLGSVPILSFMLLIPPPVIIALAITIAVYTLFVEQKILYRYFNNLVLNVLGIKTEQGTTKTKATKTIDQEIADKKIKISKIYAHYGKDGISRTNKKLEKYTIPLTITSETDLKSTSEEINSKKINASEHGFIKYNLAIIATVFILFLRAITSIGPSTLGLKNAANMVIAPLFCLAAFGPASFAICAIMATFGYAIKCSQNIHTHYYNTMEDMLGVKSENKEKKKQLKKLEREYLTALELAAEQGSLIKLDAPPVRFSLGGKASSGNVDFGRTTPPPSLGGSPSPAIG